MFVRCFLLKIKTFSKPQLCLLHGIWKTSGESMKTYLPGQYFCFVFHIFHILFLELKCSVSRSFWGKVNWRKFFGGFQFHKSPKNYLVTSEIVTCRIKYNVNRVFLMCYKSRVPRDISLEPNLTRNSVIYQAGFTFYLFDDLADESTLVKVSLLLVRSESKKIYIIV